MSLGGDSYVQDLICQKQMRDELCRQEALEEAYVLYEKALASGITTKSDQFFLTILQAVTKKLRRKYRQQYKVQDQRFNEVVQSMIERLGQATIG